MDSSLIAPTILVVDDDVISSSILEIMLKNDGFRILRAPNGMDGRTIAHRENPDLILMDVNMPVENGIDACRKLKETSDVADIPVIFVTSVQDVESKVSGFEAGGVDYITKPYERAEVAARIRLHLRLRQAYESLVKLHISKVNQLTDAQMSILTLPGDLPGAQFSVQYKPLHEAGGDFYDVVQVGTDVYDFVVADVCGHDLGTSLATAALKGVLHQDQNLIYTPVESVRMINRVMGSILREEQFLTLAYVRLNRSSRTLTIVNAGHPPVIVVDGNGEPKKLETCSDILGAFESVHIESHEIRISRGDRFFLYTDGIIERGNSKPQNQQLDRLIAACTETMQLSINNTSSTIVEKVLSDGDIVKDDILLLAVEA